MSMIIFPRNTTKFQATDNLEEIVESLKELDITVQFILKETVEFFDSKDVVIRIVGRATYQDYLLQCDLLQDSNTLEFVGDKLSVKEYDKLESLIATKFTMISSERQEGGGSESTLF